MTTGSVSPRRADTRRNHERILTAAAESLAGSEALSFNAIAKQAGVGVGTVYRHFPTPEALILAVYRRELRHLVDVVLVIGLFRGSRGSFLGGGWQRVLLGIAVGCLALRLGLLLVLERQLALEAGRHDVVSWLGQHRQPTVVITVRRIALRTFGLVRESPFPSGHRSSLTLSRSASESELDEAASPMVVGRSALMGMLTPAVTGSGSCS